MFANTSTPEQDLNPISQWEDEGGAPSPAKPSEKGCVNVGLVERALSAYVGGSLFTWGLSRRSLPGLAIAAVGGALVYRGATGHCRLYNALGMSTADQDSALTAFASGCAPSGEASCCSAPDAGRTMEPTRQASVNPDIPANWDMPTVRNPSVSAPIASVVEKTGGS